MDTNLEKLNEYLKTLDEFKLPDYKELPSIPLYMEQVISYIGETLEPVINDGSQIITPFMVNNYVKAKIIAPPVQKKYQKDHIGYLLAISLLKNATNLKDIASFIEIDKKYSTDKQKLYDIYKSMQDEVFKYESHRVKARLDALNKGKKKPNKQGDNTVSDDELLNLTYIALRLSIESQTTKLIANQIMNLIGESVLPKEVINDKKKENEIEMKKINVEANKLRNRNKK